MTCVFHIVCVCVFFFVFVIFGARPSVVVVFFFFGCVCVCVFLCFCWNNTCLPLLVHGKPANKRQVKHPMFSVWDLTSTGKPCQVGSKLLNVVIHLTHSPVPAMFNQGSMR